MNNCIYQGMEHSFCSNHKFGATETEKYENVCELIALWFPEVSEIHEFIKGTGIHCQAFYRIPVNLCTAATITIVFAVLHRGVV
jgi:hypothetical protein